jgi:alpha-glucosidase
LNLSDIKDKNMASLPVLVEIEEGPKVIISEANLEDYPGLYLKGTDGQNFSFIGIFPAYPIKEEQKDDRTMIVSERADYIALTDGKRCFPWRIIGIAEEDGDLIESELVCKLAKPLQLEDVSWIKPGKVAWDWWNANNVYGVDFKSGVNTETYKYYIDFAAANNIEYIIMDEGWSDTENLLKVNPNIDMKEILSYADEKNVGVILWCVWLTLDKQLEQALDRFEEWRIKGIKVDFMQRDDQKMVNFYHKIVKEAAKRHMLVDFHGAYKPTGLRRAYPNLVTREGVLGLEWNKWSADCNPEHDLTIPFIRMFAGPMDYTPGAMNNAQEVNFRDIFERPMSQGTRVHQLAMYVVYESPLQMLADSPSNYMKEPEIVSFLSKVPTTWDETIVLEAKVSDYVIIARKSGDDWYIGAMTDWTSRKFQIDLSFLDGGKYNAEIYQDGINADRYASDYKRVIKVISKNDKIDIDLAPGGGWVARIHK